MPGVHELTATGTTVRCQVDRAALDEVVGRLNGTSVGAFLAARWGVWGRPARSC